MSFQLDGVSITTPVINPNPDPNPESSSPPPSFPASYPSISEQPEQELLSSEREPITNATLTIRCVKSFEYRTMKALVMRELDLTKITVGEMVEKCKQAIKTAPGFKPFRTVDFDTLKLYTQAHSHKTMNLIINIDHDEWILEDKNKTMADYGAVNETEYSLFNRELYETFKNHPDVQKW